MASTKRPRLTKIQKLKRHRTERAYVLLLLAQIAMGSGAIFGRLALEHMGALSVAAWRLTLAAIPLGIRYLMVRPPRPRWRQEIRLGIAGVLLAVQFAAWIGSLLRLSVGVSTLLVCTTPLWTGLYEGVILRHPLKRSFWVALGVAVVGICLMVLDGGGQAPLPGQAPVGVALALLSSFGMSGYFIIVQRVSTLAERQKSYDTVDIITRTYAYSAVLLLGLSLFDTQPLPAVTDWRAWVGVVGMALVTQGMGHTLQNASLRHIRPTIVGFATLLEPLISAVLAVFLFHETLSVRAMVGGGLVMVALGWALRVMSATEGRAAAKAPEPARHQVA